jgi:hypothetical protein
MIPMAGTTSIPRIDVPVLKALKEITGKYPLLGLFLLVTEGLLGFLILRAADSAERIFIGCFMVLLLGGFLYVVVLVQREPTKVLEPPGLPGGVNPGRVPATYQEIAEAPTPQESAHHESQVIAGPDRSYLIDRPPLDWTIRELSPAEFVRSGLQIADPSTVEDLFGEMPSTQDILTFDANRVISVMPLPGKTIINGRRTLPTALEMRSPTRLSILPMDRYVPPFFTERSLLHNFLSFVSSLLALPIAINDLRTGSLPDSQRSFVSCTFRQELKHVTINNKEDNADIITSVMGIEGELRDYLIIMNYAHLPNGFDPALDQDKKTLQSLTNSFRPIEVIDPEGKKKQIMEKADQQLDELVKEKGEDMFFTELVLLVSRFQESDLEDLGKRTEAIRLLKPFEAAASVLQINDDEWSAFWESLRQAEKGDASDFVSQFSELREMFLQGANDSVEQEEEDSFSHPTPTNHRGEKPVSRRKKAPRGRRKE